MKHAIFAVVSLLTAGEVHAQCPYDQLVPGGRGLAFGRSAALSGDRAVVGAYEEAYVFDRTPAGWAQVAELVSPAGGPPAARIGFGNAVALQANTLLAGGGDVFFNPSFAAVYETGQCIPGAPFCAGTGCPCGNDDVTAGCESSRGSGAQLLASGSASISGASLVLTATNCPADNSGLFFAGDAALSPAVFLGDGLGCVGGATFHYPAGVVSFFGTFTLADPFGPAPVGFIAPGVTRHFQAWTRDVLCGPPPSPCTTPCGTNSNLTNAYSVTFEP